MEGGSLFPVLQELACSFSEISAQDTEKLLRTILSSQQPDRCKKAQAFIATQGLEPEAVADLVAEEVVQELLAWSQREGGEWGRPWGSRLSASRGQNGCLDAARGSVGLSAASVCSNPLFCTTPAPALHSHPKLFSSLLLS